MEKRRLGLLGLGLRLGLGLDEKRQNTREENSLSLSRSPISNARFPTPTPGTQLAQRHGESVAVHTLRLLLRSSLGSQAAGPQVSRSKST